MKISRKLRYGLRAMIALALYDQAGPVSAKDISAAEAIPLNYLEQIFNKLKKSGLVKATRGPRGGYSLSRLPAKIPIKHIMDALEPSPYLLDCLDKKGSQKCESAESCHAILFWQALDRAVKTIAENTSLKELADKGPKQALIRHTYVFQI